MGQNDKPRINVYICHPLILAYLLSIYQDELEAEFDALGDDLLLDDDTSFLDDAVTAPSIPTSEPGGETVKTQDGVLLDEFGLPQIPTN